MAARGAANCPMCDAAPRAPPPLPDPSPGSNQVAPHAYARRYFLQHSGSRLGGASLSVLATKLVQELNLAVVVLESPENPSVRLRVLPAVRRWPHRLAGHASRR